MWGFKSRRADEWHMECVADSTTMTSPAVPHEARLEVFESLLGGLGEVP